MIKLSKRGFYRKNFYIRDVERYYHSAAIDWADRVNANGGGVVDGKTIKRVSDHYKELEYHGLVSMIKSNCIFTPDSLIAATTPLIKTFGNDPWTNGNFTDADLSVHGLKGDAASKYLATGVIPSSAFPSAASGGLTIYFTDAISSVALYMDMRAQQSTNSFGIIQFNGYVHADIWNESGGRLLIAGIRNGYVSSNRISASDFKVYNATSIINHNQIGSKTTTGGSPPTTELNAFCYYDASSRAYYTGRRISYIAIHEGFTEKQSIKFFTAIQNFRKAIGGGYI